MSENKERLVNQILEIEVRMFQRVPTADEPSCRAHMEDMKLHRRGQFAGWSEKTCASYLKDLRRADAAGENLMTVKYARMDDLTPPRSSNPRINDIAARCAEWQEAFIREFPNIMRAGRDMGDFTNYLKSELETYSDATLELLWADTEARRESGINMSVEVYRYLARQSGYESLEAMERRLG